MALSFIGLLNMEKLASQSISQVVEQLIAQSPYKHKLEEATIICAWNQVMPPMIIKRTERILVKNKKLFLKISSAPLRHNLQINKEKVIALLQEAVPRYGIADIIWL